MKLTSQPSLAAVREAPGVKDLNEPARRLFAQALLAEARGHGEAAEVYLGNAITAEEFPAE